MDATRPRTGLAQGGNEVLAAAEGIVVRTFDGCPGANEASWSDRCQGGFGNHVRIRHVDGTVAQYAHLSTVEVKAGTERGPGVRLQALVASAAARRASAGESRAVSVERGRTDQARSTRQT